MPRLILDQHQVRRYALAVRDRAVVSGRLDSYAERLRLPERLHLAPAAVLPAMRRVLDRADDAVAAELGGRIAAELWRRRSA